MTDLAKTQAQWDTALGEVLGGCILSFLLDAEAFARRCADERERAVTELTTYSTDYGSLLTLSGAEPGVNLTKDGIGHVRVTDAGGGNWTISVYSATGASGLVMEGTAAASGTATLTEQNSSGLSGTWAVPASPSALAADGLQIRLYQDYRLRARRYLTAVGGDDIYAQKLLDNAYQAMAERVRSEINSFVAAARRALLSDANNPIALLNEFNNSSYDSFETEVISADTSRNWTRLAKGLFPSLRVNMPDDTSAGAQSVIERVMAHGATTFDGDNDGLGAVSTPTLLESARACTVKAECVNEEIGRETFAGTITITDDNREKKLFFSDWRVGKVFTMPGGVGPMQLTRTFSKTGDGSDLNLSDVTDGSWSVSGETPDNSDDGTWTWQVIANGSNHDINIYKSSTISDANLVTRALDVADDAAFTTTAVNGSGLVINGTCGSNPTTTTSGTISCNPFKKARAADSQPDQFTITVTETSAGLFQTLCVLFLNGYLASATAASETIGDEWAKQGTYPYDALDY